MAAFDSSRGLERNTVETMNRFGRAIRVLLFLSPVLAIAATPNGGAQEASVVAVSTFWSHSGVKPGGEITLAVVLDIREPYHVNTYTAKPPFVPIQVGITSAPKELRVSTPMFPKPHPIEFGVGNAREKIWVFSHRAVVFIPMAVNVSAQPGEAPLTVKLSYQACDDKQCLLPTSVEHQVRLPIVVTTAGVKPLAEELFAALKDYGNQVRVSFFGWNFSFAAANRLLLIFIAGLGGFLLNLTPMGLPIERFARDPLRLLSFWCHGCRAFYPLHCAVYGSSSRMGHDSAPHRRAGHFRRHRHRDGFPLLDPVRFSHPGSSYSKNRTGE